MILRQLLHPIQQRSTTSSIMLKNSIHMNCFKCHQTSSIRSNIYLSNFNKGRNCLLQKCLTLYLSNLRNMSMSSTCYSIEKRLGTEYEEGVLLYVGGNVGNTIKRAQMFLYSLGALTLVASPMIFFSTEVEIMKYVIVTWAFLFGVANPSMFYKFMQRYVLELYHDKKEDKYTAYIPSPFIAGRSKVVFSPEECKMPPKITAFTSFLVKGRPIFVNSDSMSYSAYMRMLRYASEFDYENPERQQQYKDAVQQSIERITKPNHEETDKDKKP